MRTGSTAATVALGLAPSGWPDRFVSGSPFGIADPRVSGAGRVTGGFAAAEAGLPRTGYCARGAAVDFGGITLSLPAHSVTTVRYRVRLAAPVWPGMRPSVLAYAAVPAIDPGGGPWQRLGRVRLTRVGRTGVRIVLRAAAGARMSGRGEGALVRLGRPVLIAGSTRPRLVHAALRVAAVSLARSSRPRRLAIRAIRTGADGRFSVSWRPPTAGTYVITATVVRGTSAYVSDTGCDLTLVAAARHTIPRNAANRAAARRAARALLTSVPLPPGAIRLDGLMPFLARHRSAGSAETGTGTEGNNRTRTSGLTAFYRRPAVPGVLGNRTMAVTATALSAGCARPCSIRRTS
jgi:hypothetical protein